MSADKKNPPLIKKIIKKGHGGHHGGSWKVAYADFVTAMMAFFLVMWLLAISSEQGKAALEEYYKELSLTDAIFNGGLPDNFDSTSPGPGILQGGCFELKQMASELEERKNALDEREQALEDRKDERPNLAASRPTDLPQDPNLTDLPQGEEGGEGSDQTGVAPGEGYAEEQSVRPGMGTASTSEEAREAKNQFAAALTNSVLQSLGETDIGGQFVVEFVKGGLRIEIMDKEGRPMFVSGQPRLTALAQLILTSVAERLVTIPNKIAIEGHTDAVTTISQELTNWELSTARASAARRYLARRGVTDDRLTMVAGYAATAPLKGTNPTDPVNRRIAIMIWDEPIAGQSAPPQDLDAPPAAQEQGAAPQNADADSTEPSDGQYSDDQSSPSDIPPAAGSPSTTSPRTPSRTTTPIALPETPEAIEQRLLDETLQRAASPDTSTAGPPNAQE
jgi:chemotaxis protein MotB